MRLAVALLLATLTYAQSPDQFERLGAFRGMGGVAATTIGPGPTPGSERVYVSYLYLFNTIDVVSVDPATGETQLFPNPAAGEYGARCMILGRDGNMYLGSLAKAHFLKLDTKAGKLIDLGRPSPTEEYIWEVAFGSDGKLYGATYPQSKLVRWDPRTGKLEDLGRMDPNEQYAHSVAGSDDGFMYLGIGTSKANIAIYEIATGKHREVLPEDAQIVAQARVWRGADGKIYGSVGERTFRLSGWTITELKPDEAVAAAPLNRLRDGRLVEVVGNNMKITDPKTKAVSQRTFAYEGNDVPLFRIGFGPDRALYASTILPIHFVKLNESAHRFEKIGGLGGGEIYQFLNRDNRLLMAGYASVAPLMIYDPAQQFTLEGGRTNPTLVHVKGFDSSWRAQAMIAGPQGKVYFGSIAGYGKLGGPLTVWNVESGAVEEFHHLIPDQSVISLAMWNALIIGGTTLEGGGGSHTVKSEARIFIWNPETKKKEFDMVAVPGAVRITDMIVAPNGLVYGIADKTMFVFDPRTREVVKRQPIPFSLHKDLYNSVTIGADGRIWGLAAEGIFAIDPKTDTPSLVAKSPAEVTAGFGVRDGAIYLVCGSTVYRYKM